MKRDGATVSLWQKGTDFTPKTKEIGDQVLDVLIVGGGVSGITTALQLQKAGRTCVVAEAHNLCFGTTGGTTAHLNTFFDTTYEQIKKDFGEDGAQTVARATEQALALYRSNVQTYAIDCGFAERDGYLYSQNDQQSKVLDDIFKASQQAGTAVEYTDSIPVSVPFQRAIVYRRQAQLHPVKYVIALASAFEEAGGIIVENCEVNSFNGSDVLEVSTTAGTIRARNLIWATHIPPGINLLHFRCAPYRSYALAVTLKNDNYPGGLAYDMYDPYHYYRTQEVDGQKYLIVGGEDHKTAHEANTEACFTRLEAYIRQHYDVDQVAFRWSSQYFEPSDGLAYIGHLPGNPENVFVATGYGGNGMTYSHIAAITLTDLITKGDSEFAHLFRPARVKPVAGFANFVKENADVVAQFVGKRIHTDKITELADLAHGEARLVRYEGQRLAIYKSESGQVHALNPVCTHAKCVVGWNTAEKSWDCPCHGARYDVDGNVLTGPARKGLEVVSLGGISNF
jgi:hypothetical protein